MEEGEQAVSCAFRNLGSRETLPSRAEGDTLTRAHLVLGRTWHLEGHFLSVCGNSGKASEKRGWKMSRMEAGKKARRGQGDGRNLARLAVANSERTKTVIKGKRKR